MPALVFALALAATSANAQCQQQWLPGDGLPGADGFVLASTMWDPDGSGPEQPVLVMGGSFSLAGDAICSGIASWEPTTQTWSSFGTGVNGSVQALASLANGDLVAGGTFTNAGGTSASRIARWNGSAWSAIGSGADGEVHAIAELPGGDLVIGGEFVQAGGVVVNHIARWDGSTWSAMGGGMTWPNATLPTSVEALAVMPNGDLIAGGWFTHVDGAPSVGIARWDGSSWSTLGTGVNSGVTALLALPNGDLAVGGQFGTAGGVSARGVARWDGSQWFGYGGSGIFQGGQIGSVRALAVAPNGLLFAAGVFNIVDGLPKNNIAQWNGAAWLDLDDGVGTTLPDFAATLTSLPNGEVVCGGRFSTVGQEPCEHVARWQGFGWATLDAGPNDAIHAIVATGDGDTIAGGMFRSAGGAAASYIASHDGSSWTPLGPGLQAPITSLAVAENGDILAAGESVLIGPSPVARWDGSTWSWIGSYLGPVQSIVARANGDLVIGGSFTFFNPFFYGLVARWDGAEWVSMSNGMSFPPIVGGSVHRLHELANGDLLAAGQIALAGSTDWNNVGRWDGTTWQQVGGSFDGPIAALAETPNGDIIACGSFLNVGGATANRIARWTGSSWVTMGTGLDFPANDLQVLANGDVIVGGSFSTAGGIPADRLARWNGSVWSSIGPLVAAPDNTGPVLSLAQSRSGELLIGGAFASLGDHVAPHFARLAPTCPATSVDLGGGCTTASGTPELVAETLPWLGAKFDTRGTNLAPLTIASVVTGFAPTSIPMSSVLPEGQPGCNLLVTPDVLGFELASNGEVASSFLIPNAAALLGGTFYQQLNPLEFDAAFQLVAITASNSLELTIGTF